MPFSFVRFVECVFIFTFQLIDLTEKTTPKSTTSKNSIKKNYVLNYVCVMCYGSSTVLWANDMLSI